MPDVPINSARGYNKVTELVLHPHCWSGRMRWHA